MVTIICGAVSFLTGAFIGMGTMAALFIGNRSGMETRKDENE